MFPMTAEMGIKNWVLSELSRVKQPVNEIERTERIVFGWSTSLCSFFFFWFFICLLHHASALNAGSWRMCATNSAWSRSQTIKGVMVRLNRTEGSAPAATSAFTTSSGWRPLSQAIPSAVRPASSCALKSC